MTFYCTRFAAGDTNFPHFLQFAVNTRLILCREFALCSILLL